jgi:hypothetical protein
VRNAHQEFAKILPAQETDEGTGRFPKPLNHVFAILDPSLANPGGDIVHKIPITPDKVGDDEGELTASFDERTVTYSFGELDTLVPAYAATIHKSQGSEYPAVVIPVMTQHYAMLQRNLLYTGVTRGKRLVVLVGQKKAVAIAVRNVSGRRRWSKLAAWLSTDPSKRYTSA